MVSLTTGTENLSRMRYGVAYQLMQLEDCSLLVVLEALLKCGKGMPASMHTYHEQTSHVRKPPHPPARDHIIHAMAVERHCVSLLTDIELDAYPNRRGAIIDNDKRIGVRLLDATDRTIDGSRKVFDSLFPFAAQVRITGAFKLVDLADYDVTTNNGTE